MFKNGLKIALRLLRKNKLYATVNIVGLAIGIASCLLIGLYIWHELSFDRFHKNADRIVRVTMDYNLGDAQREVALTGTKIGPQFKRTFPQVQAFARTYKRTRVLSSANTVFEEKNFLYADSSFFEMFSFPFLEGDSSTALNASNKIVVTHRMATKYFGKEDALGKILKVGDDNFEITGVVADVPSTSQLQFDFVASFSSLAQAREEKRMEANYITYLLLNNKDQIAPLQKQVAQYMKSVSQNELRTQGSQYLTFHLEPLTSVHLYSSLSGFDPNGNITYIYILTIVAVLILCIACVNYVNLAIVQTAGRTEEISMRKILGAKKAQIFNQFICESFFITVVAVLIAECIALSSVGLFNNLSGKQFSATDLIQLRIVLPLLFLALIISLTTGSYPAYLISNAKLIQLLKSKISFSSGGLKKPLIVFQFIISSFLILSTIIILQQLNYIKRKDLGYNKDNVLVLPLDDKTYSHFSELKAAIKSLPEVRNVTAAYGEPVNVQWSDNIKGENGQEVTVNAIPCDEDFVRTLALKIISGLDFTRADLMQMDTSDNGKNMKYSFMLNEAAVKALGWNVDNAIGKSISKGEKAGTVRAVVKDFHFHSLHEPITPLILFLSPQQTNSVFIKTASAYVPGALSSIKKVWEERVSHRPFEYHFLDEDYDALYKTEQRTAGVFATFSTLAILLACLGLFALTAFTMVQRTKEIGIRKILGATIPDILSLVSKDFLKLVVIALLIATPIAWYAIHKWLDSFAYRIPIQWWIFVLAGMAMMIIAFVTISLQAIKTAMSNPVKNLRSE